MNGITMKDTDKVQLIEIVASFDSISETDALEVLSHTRRHCLIRELSHQSPPVALDTIARDVADRTGGKTDGAARAQHRNEIRTNLHHFHLPKLDAVGLIEYDTQETVIREILPELREHKTQQRINQ